jgi:hypothetical protein
MLLNAIYELGMKAYEPTHIEAILEDRGGDLLFPIMHLGCDAKLANIRGSKLQQILWAVTFFLTDCRQK